MSIKGVSGIHIYSWHSVHDCVFNCYTDIIAKALYRRHVDSAITSTTGVKKKSAKLLPANIAARPAQSTDQLVEQHVSRKKIRAAEI